VALPGYGPQYFAHGLRINVQLFALSISEILIYNAKAVDAAVILHKIWNL
jgi:hypothetical protein